MIAFITGVLWFTGRGSSPMFNLYLLPIISSALTLGRRVTLLQVAAICVCRVLLAAATPDLTVLSLLFAGRMIGELAPILLVAYLTSTLSADVSEARERIENLAQTDPLTGLLNHRVFNEIWQKVHAESTERRMSYALLMIDIDQLKQINDSFGHEAGSDALKLVAQCLQRSIRNTDHAARFGGDEFAVLLPNAEMQVTEAIVNRIRNNVYKTTLDLRSRMIRCSVSVGVANYPKDAADVHALLSTADRNLYRDKELRRTPDVKVNA
jgi:diguanylate cyclase (GGDEF)-like protein